jgi:hypothetical protein
MEQEKSLVIEPLHAAHAVTDTINHSLMDVVCAKSIPLAPGGDLVAWGKKVGNCVEEAEKEEAGKGTSSEPSDSTAVNADQNATAQAENQVTAEQDLGTESTAGDVQARASGETGTVSQVGDTQTVQVNANQTPDPGVTDVQEASMAQTTATCNDVTPGWCSELKASTTGPCDPGEHGCGFAPSDQPVSAVEPSGQVETAAGSQLPDQVNEYVDQPGAGQSSTVATEEDIGATTTSPLPGEADTSLLDVSSYAKVGSVLKGAGDAMTGFGIVYGTVTTFNDLANGDYRGAGATALSTGLNVYTGMALEPVDVAIMEVSVGLGDGPGIVVGIVGVVLVNYGASQVVGWVSSAVANAVGDCFAWLESHLFDIYAPDIFVRNRTGEAQNIGISVQPEHTYDVSPPFSAAAQGNWVVTASPGGELAMGTKHLSELHYELTTTANWQYATGWTVPRSRFDSWARATLAAYGFSERATDQFLVTWSAFASGGGSLTIYPQEGALVQSLEPMTVTPSGLPKLRVWFVISPAVRGRLTAPIVPPDPAGRAPLEVQEWGVVPLPGSLAGVPK